MRPGKPEVDAATAQAWARDSFGISARASELPGEVDRNFLLEAEDGQKLVLKVAPRAIDRAELECQLSALDHLQRQGIDFTPRVLRNLQGEFLSERRTAGGESVLVRAVEYLEGQLLAECEHPEPTFWQEFGRGLASLDRALESFDHPSTRRNIPWDLERLLELEPLLDAVEAGTRSHVAAGLTRFRERVAPRLDSLPRGVIHNDANDYNVLVRRDPEGSLELAGLIDFGDMLQTITVAELTIACTYAMMDRPNPWTVAERIIAGYEEARPLESLERELLPDLILGRLCNSLLLSAQARRDSPDDGYLTISERPAAALLKRLLMESGPQRAPERTPQEILEIRRSHLGRNLSVSYGEPLKIVRGEGQYLFDEGGRRYLDLINNVCHVGHCHPRVVEAGQQQMARLNTNTRYLHDLLAEYILRLSGTMPDPLSVCFLVCTGTEANDLALRLARTHTGRKEVLVLEHAYHGHSPSLIELSTYKCEGPGGEGLAQHAHKLPCPDPYRGKFSGDDAGRAYGAEAEDLIQKLVKEGEPPGAFLAESLLGCGGQIVPAAGFLPRAHAATRNAGGVCIADEVQVGFGRVGTHMWAFEMLKTVPDIVTLGKPIGNGHPLAAVVTTPEIAESFDTGMEYFNTFGGNPVSCAIGLAVLDVIEEEGLQAHALAMGRRMKSGLEELARRHELIGDVRGAGLFLGVELVRDRETKSPAGQEAAALVEAMKQRGILLSTDGPDHNVIKIKPPLVLNEGDLDDMLGAMEESLRG